MKFLEVLVEGTSDQLTVRTILQRRFSLIENRDFRIHPHQGRGNLSKNPHQKPDPRHRGLLDHLPAKLKGYSSFPGDRCVVVLLDADDTPCKELKKELVELHRKLNFRPSCTLFRIAVEETESWFIADLDAVRRAYPKVKVADLARIKPDSVVGASELLARVLGQKKDNFGRAEKTEWATRIAPHLDLDEPKSPSLKAFITGIQKLMGDAESNFEN